MKSDPTIQLLDSPVWSDYELLDCGGGLKLERFGPHRLVRPEAQILWRPALGEAEWRETHAVFRTTGEESGGHWEVKKKMAEPWEMESPILSRALISPPPGGSPRDMGGAREEPIRFWAMTTPGRHLGVFPEGAVHWEWCARLIAAADRPVRVLNLFGYTGIASLAAAGAGAAVTHVDASRKSVSWARENQALSGLADRPIRWIVDDALKFVQREGRRGAQYDGILLDPPKFGRGPKGEVWEVYKSLPMLLEACREVLSPTPLFVVLTVYAVRASATHLYFALEELMQGYGGAVTCGELVTREKSAGRMISNAVYARWGAEG